MPIRLTRAGGFHRVLHSLAVPVLAFIGLIGVTSRFLGHIWGIPQHWFEFTVLGAASVPLLWAYVAIHRATFTVADEAGSLNRRPRYVTDATDKRWNQLIVGVCVSTFVIAMIVSGGGWNVDTWDVIMTP